MKLKVATVQMTTDDRDKARVVDKVVRMIDEAGAQGADLIVLPEVWTGLGYADAYPFEAMAEPIPGPTTDTLTALARRHGAMIVGSMYERAADGRHFNTAPFINRDGAILGCFGDPGIEAAREMVRMPVIGPGEAAMLVAASLGHRFSIVTVLDTLDFLLHRLAWQVGVDRKLASVRSIGVPVLSLGRDPEDTFARMAREGARARDQDRADVIVMGCMTMAFQDRHHDLAQTLGIPVVNPVHAAVKLMQAFCAMGLSHSRRAYPTPPKLAALAADGGREAR